ncbi:type II toxin-antitoxin system Phd/YefM family antitoxin [Nostocoides veronense]|uniref:Antitoxin n=1 Tax=Nostocoides veronense TaxID=330836 RepID=A0ABP4Y4E5_9MICO
MTTMSAREFNRDVSAAKRHAAHGPVVITDRGEPSFVLLSMAEYRRLIGAGGSLVDRLSMDDDLEIEFEPVRLDLTVPTL